MAVSDYNPNVPLGTQPKPVPFPQFGGGPGQIGGGATTPNFMNPYGGQIYRPQSSGVQQFNPGPGYQSDIASLRSMPGGLSQSYQKYIGQVQQQPQYATGAQAEISRLRQTPSYFPQWQQSAQYLRQNPGSTGYDQAYLTTARQNIEDQYKSAHQQIIMDAQRRGIDPTSGVVQQRFQDLENSRQRQLSDTQNQLAMWKVGETRSRQQEARGVEQQMEDYTTGRMQRAGQMEEGLDTALLGRRGLETSLFGQMYGQEQQGRAAARGVEQQLDATERQRLNDLYGWATGNVPAEPPSLAGQFANQSQEQAMLAGQQYGQAMGGFGSAAMQYAILTNPALRNMFLSPFGYGNYNPYGPYNPASVGAQPYGYTSQGAYGAPNLGGLASGVGGY